MNSNNYSAIHFARNASNSQSDQAIKIDYHYYSAVYYIDL